MEKLLEAANRAGYATMIAGIDADNAASIRMHERFGFTFAGKIVKAGVQVRPLARSRFLPEASRRPEAACW